MTRDFDPTTEEPKMWRPDEWKNRYADDISSSGAHRREAFEKGADAMLGPAFVAGVQYAAKHLG